MNFGNSETLVMTTNKEWTAEYMQMIEDCMNRSEKMTEWEQNFIDSCWNQLGKKNFLSPKQIEIVDRIWEKVA